MVPTQVFAVRGKVVTAPKAAFDHTIVMLRPRGAATNASSTYQASVDKDGSFEVSGVPPGSYVAMAIGVALKTGAPQQPKVAQMKFDVPEANVEGLLLRLTNTGVKLNGRVVVEGRPAFDISQLNIVFQPADIADNTESYDSLDSGNSGFARPKSDGSFVVENLKPGSYFPEIFSSDTGARDYYMKAVRYGSKDISDGELMIDEAAPTQPLEILVGSGGQTVDGIVKDPAGKPAAGALVVALPDAKRRKRLGSYDRSVSDQQGRFALRGLQPGEYTLIALDEDDDELAFDPEFLQQFESKGVAFKARERGRDTVTLKLVPVDNP